MTTANEVISNSKLEGNNLKLPEGQLDRKLYVEVKKKLELIGGKWKSGKIQAFVFDRDPKDLLDKIVSGEKVNPKKEFQFFATPENLANRLVEMADLKADDVVLEPSAGQGAIVKAINQKFTLRPSCYELMDINREVLSKSELVFDLLGDDFLESKDEELFTKIIANPPFSKNQDIDHVLKMYKVLKPNGRIVSVMSKHWLYSSTKKCLEFREFLDNVDSETVYVGAGTFKESGTNIETAIVIIDKK